jgi:LPXTG-motif cell wall-anchored protein
MLLAAAGVLFLAGGGVLAWRRRATAEDEA